MTILERLTRDGIRRIGSPARGFRYRTAAGRAVGARERARIEALRIPPAWKDVAIHPSHRAWVQAIGRDAKGRTQYLYHQKQVARRERNKLDRMVRFIRALPKLRRAVARDLSSAGLPRERVLAGIVRILGSCFLRPGGDVYATQNGSFGIATLRPRHVSVRGDTLRFDFVGKSSRRQMHEVKDRQVAKLVRELLRHPGEVFKFRNGDGAMVDVKGQHINAYIQERMGERFTAKDFRTWAGSLLAASALARMPAESRSSPAASRRAIAAAMREVAESLGNTPAVCRSSYVFPVVLRRFEEGRVLRHPVAGIPRGTRSIERCERGLLALLAPGAQGGNGRGVRRRAR
jgi:DNA topoisomerase-1